MRSSFQPTAWIAADIVRVVDGVLVEHWDVIEDDASRDASKRGLPMFGSGRSHTHLPGEQDGCALLPARCRQQQRARNV